MTIARRAAEPPQGGLGAVAAAWTAGMGLFVLLVFAYYAAYDMVLPLDNRVLPPLAAALLGLAGIGAQVGGRRPVDQAAGRGPWPRADAIWGNAVLSRYPIVADGAVSLPREGVPLRRNYLWVELDIGAQRRLRAVVTHLHHVQGPDGARVRQAQIPRLLRGAVERPATVLMGDLNAEPDSREIAMLREAGLVDAFEAAGAGPAAELTWPSDRPDRRIDYIWCSSDLTATGFVATSGTASDHRGIMATVRPAA